MNSKGEKKSNIHTKSDLTVVKVF